MDEDEILEKIKFIHKNMPTSKYLCTHKRIAELIEEIEDGPEGDNALSDCVTCDMTVRRPELDENLECKGCRS